MLNLKLIDNIRLRSVKRTQVESIQFVQNFAPHNILKPCNVVFIYVQALNFKIAKRKTFFYSQASAQANCMAYFAHSLESTKLMLCKERCVLSPISIATLLTSFEHWCQFKWKFETIVSILCGLIDQKSTIIKES